VRFDPEVGWTGDAAALEPRHVTLDGLTLELRPTTSGGVGMYPEHVANLAWLAEQVRARAATGNGAQLAVLNLFAHTGLATLAAARSGAATADLGAARGAVAWGARNGEVAALGDMPQELVATSGARVELGWAVGLAG